MEQTDQWHWWQGAAIYQIYPRSFLDTTGNGVGDLQGIIDKLDHVADLGADAVWISPFVQSPMQDFGYDVSNYRAVDPLFGGLEDFHHLVERAHELGIKVIMDQVLSHTSDKHPWFLESRESRTNEKADWYVWADAGPAGAPPNNWLSVFGGSSWQWEPRRRQYYLHNFLRQQPDLNYHCPAVQKAVLDVCRFWLEMGVDGFRLDVCAFYFHDRQLRDNPHNHEEPSGKVFQFNPYSMQIHRHDIAQPENPSFLERLRSVCDEFDDRILLGELHENEAARLHKEYTAPDRLHLAYGYWLLGADEVDAGLVRSVAEQLGHAADDGWPCWALDNHDFSRAVSRLGHEDNPEAVTAMIAALTCLRGATCIYQGSELGLAEADVPLERIVDPYGREFYPAYRGRDGARTPMPWKSDDSFGGFSSVEPWLPIPAAHRDRAVDMQLHLPGSTLNRLKRFLNWRRDIPALRCGSMKFLDMPATILAFERTSGSQTVMCIFNLDGRDAMVPISEERAGSPMDGHGFGCVREADELCIPGWGAFFGERG